MLSVLFPLGALHPGRIFIGYFLMRLRLFLVVLILVVCLIKLGDHISIKVIVVPYAQKDLYCYEKD